MFNSKAGICIFRFLQAQIRGKAVLWVEVTSGCSISALRSQGKETLPWNGALYLIRKPISHFSVELWDPF